MKALYLLALISCVSAQINFNTNFNKPSTTATLTTGTNGVIVDLKATTKYAYIISDPIVPATTAQDFYITLLCANTAVDFGPTLGTISSSTYASSGANPLIGGPTNPFTDYLSLYYPYVPQKAATYDPTIATLGKTYRYTVISYDDSNYYEFKIRDMDDNYYGTTPINPQGVQTGGNGFFNYMKKSYLQLSFGLEVLNCGEAVFCVQTKEQAEANPGNCGTTETYTTDSCTSTTTCSDYALCDASKPFQLLLLKTCYETCPGNYPQVSDLKCQDCDDTCLTCIDTNSQNCLTCHEGKYQMNGQCLDTCPDGTSFHFEGKCVKSCPDDATFLIGTGCYHKCPSGYFQDSETTCAPCTSPCKECSGSATTCTSCVSSSPLLYQSACYESCPAGSHAVDETSCTATVTVGGGSGSGSGIEVAEASSGSDSGLPKWGLGLILGLCIGIPVVVFTLCMCYKLKIHRKNKYTQKEIAYVQNPKTPVSAV